jgi:hypothetical protein
MDYNRFDDLTRTLATTTSRRGFLKTLAGGAAGGMLALLGIGEAAAKDCTKTGKKCKDNKECCSGLCSNGTCVSCLPPGGTPGCDPEEPECFDSRFCCSNAMVCDASTCTCI